MIKPRKKTFTILPVGALVHVIVTTSIKEQRNILTEDFGFPNCELDFNGVAWLATFPL